MRAAARGIVVKKRSMSATTLRPTYRPVNLSTLSETSSRRKQLRSTVASLIPRPVQIFSARCAGTTLRPLRIHSLTHASVMAQSDTSIMNA